MGEQFIFDKERQAVLVSDQDGIWEEKTFNINAMYKAYYYGQQTGYDIYFRGGNKKYFYPNYRVRIIDMKFEIDISKMDVYIDDVKIDAKRVVSFPSGYYRIYTLNGKIFSNAVKFEGTGYRDRFTYYSKLAEYAEKIAEPESPLFFLSRNYRRISPSPQSALKDYLRGECKTNESDGLFLLPFDFNQSQIKAIDAALSSNISIIEGPPGTGKTQTILNLIVNIIFRGKNCAVVSNNNTAVDNVYEKLSDEGFGFLAAALGRKENVDQFFDSDQEEGLNQFLSKKNASPRSDYRNRLNELSIKMKTIQDTEVETSKLESELDNLKIEQRHLVNSISIPIVLNPSYKTNDYFNLISRIEQPKRIGFFERLLLGWKFGIKLSKVELNDVLIAAESMYYVKRIDEVNHNIERNKDFLKNQSMSKTIADVKSLSRQVLDDSIAKRYSGLESSVFNKASYKKDFRNFLSRYPVVLSTSQSLLNNAPNSFLFDYLIIDEASQGDLLSSILAISCAKNLVVVGDSRQLQQIDDTQLFSESEKLAQDYDITKEYQYSTNSILKSVKAAVKNVPTTLLREHYRCAPDIIQFCNNMFYHGELIVMTKNSGRHIEIIKTVPGNHARRNPIGSGMYNQREIDEIESIVKANPKKEIGVISPFRYQADLISTQISDDSIEADTIHKFQGRQKEEVILSFVVNSLDKDPNAVENRLYDFVTNEKLLNVAISRGRNKVTAIVSDKLYHSTNNIIHDFIQYAEYLYGSSSTKESVVTSVFDCLYADYNKYLTSVSTSYSKDFPTEIIMKRVIDEVLVNFNYIGYSMHPRLSKLIKKLDIFSSEEQNYLLHPWSHVDFMIYHKVSRDVLFVIEVDGVRYHEQDVKQSVHDEIKDRALKHNNITVYRFKTNEANEKQRLSSIIQNHIHS
jgi:superfamily I DNA and/or RNA helicase